MYTHRFLVDLLLSCVMRYRLHNVCQAEDFLYPYLRYFLFSNDMRPKLMAEDSTLTHLSVSTKVSELWKEVRQRKRMYRIVDLVDFHADIWGFRRLAEEIVSLNSEKRCGSRVVVTGRY